MNHTYHSYCEALKNIKAPALVVDLDAFEFNIKWTLDNAGSKKIRLATKSLRSTELIKRILDSSPIFQGLMCYTLEEAIWLRSLGFKNILLAHPTSDKETLEELAKNPREITLAADLVEHLEILEALGKKYQTTFSVCLDIDLSMELPTTRFGIYRSSINSRTKLKHFLETLKHFTHIKMIGLMGYEAQIAALPDKNSPMLKTLKRVSNKQLKIRRQKMIELVESYGHKLEFVNGGGTGSLHETKHEKSVTEMTVGSAFYAPAQFDHYESFSLRPSMFFTLAVVRKPMPFIYASGPQDSAKLTHPYLPRGMQLIKHEGADVQTPFEYRGEEELKLGDIVMMREAKAGEVCERFDKIHLIRENSYEGVTPTYRGEGKTFL